MDQETLTAPGDRFDGTTHGLWKRVVDGGTTINHAAWLRACAEGGFVGTCRACGGYLKPVHPEQRNGHTDYEAHCAIGHVIVAPDGRVPELHKLGAQLFVYGFYDEYPDQIVLAVAIDVVMVLRRLALRQLRWTQQSRIDQTFLGFSFRDLDTIGAVLHRYDSREQPVAQDMPPELSPVDELAWPQVRRPADWIENNEPDGGTT